MPCLASSITRSKAMTKRSNLTRRGRNEKIAAWAVANPCSTLQEIGDYYGISRERVRQILKKQGVHKPAAKKVYNGPVCSECGKHMPTATRDNPVCHGCTSMLITIICSGCGTSFQRKRCRLIKGMKYRPDLYKGKAYFCGNDCRLAHTPEEFKATGRANLLAYTQRLHAKTHCRHGHEFTEDNTYYRNNGKWRQCKTCVRRAARDYARRKRAAK